MPDLTYLITRQSGLLAWYPLTNTEDSLTGPIVDESGNGRDLEPPVGLDVATIPSNQLNGYKAVVHDNNIDLRAYIGVHDIKDIFIVGKVDDTTDFDAPYRGLFTGIDDTNYAFFVGLGGSTRWIGTAEGAATMGYLLDDVAQGDLARTAPFNEFHRMRMSTSGAGITVDGWQVGRDREHTDRLFKGKWADLSIWSTQRTTEEAQAIALYHDLKFNLWRTNGTMLNFPTPGMTGVEYRHFREIPYDWRDVTRTHEYEDGGMSFNETTDTPPREWRIEFDVVAARHDDSKIVTDIFDAFWDAVRISRPFNFTDKYGVTHTNVRIKEYSREHSAHRSWRHDVAFRLVKYP